MTYTATLTNVNNYPEAVVFTMPDGVDFAEHVEAAVRALRILNNEPDAPAQKYSPVDIAYQMVEAVSTIRYRIVETYLDLKNL